MSLNAFSTRISIIRGGPSQELFATKSYDELRQVETDTEIKRAFTHAENRIKFAGHSAVEDSHEHCRTFLDILTINNRKLSTLHLLEDPDIGQGLKLFQIQKAASSDLLPANEFLNRYSIPDLQAGGLYKEWEDFDFEMDF
jgi:hypothetical protein